MRVYKKRTMQGYANGIWSVISSLTDDYMPLWLKDYVNLYGRDYDIMELPNMIDFRAGKMPENLLYPPLSNKHPNFSVELVVYEAQVFGGGLSAYFNEIESTLNDELRKDEPDYYAIRFIKGLKEYADRYKRYAKILTLLEELIYYHQTGKNPYTKLADGRLYRYSMMPRAHELLNIWVCKLLKVVEYYTHVYARNECHKGASRDGLEVVDGLSTEKVEMRPPELPDELNNDEAKKWLQVAIDGGLLNDDYSNTSKTGTKAQKALLAEILSGKIGLEHKYKTFERLWGVSGLSKQRYKSIEEVGKVKGGNIIEDVFRDK